MILDKTRSQTEFLIQRYKVTDIKNKVRKEYQEKMWMENKNF